MFFSTKNQYKEVINVVRNQITNVVIFALSFPLYKSFIVGKNQIKVMIHQREYKKVKSSIQVINIFLKIKIFTSC